MPRVGFIVELFPPHVGGLERRFDILTEWLSKNGFEVDVHTARYDPSMLEYEKRGNVSVFRHDVGSSYVRGSKRSLSGTLKFALRSFLLKTLSDYDVYYLSEWPLVHSILSPVRLSRTVQEWCEVLEGRFLFLEKLAAKSSEHHIAVSEFTLERAKRILNLERIALVPTPLKLEEIRSYRKPRIEGRIVYAGRLMLHKHVDLLISSFHEVRREMPCAELHIVGVGPEEPILKKMAERVDGVTMWGNLSDPDLYALLSTASVFALASEREGDGISALEAMAFGVPIVTSLSRNNAAVRFAEEGAGISVLPDIGKFSEACMKIMSDTDLWRKFSRQATQIAERRNVDKIGMTLAGVLKEVAFK